jgi:hypothetical protein
MHERGLGPEFPADALAEVAALKAVPRTTGEAVRDWRTGLSCSIDDDHSRDLDQLSVAETLPGGVVKVLSYRYVFRREGGGRLGRGGCGADGRGEHTDALPIPRVGTTGSEEDRSLR